ncbi:LiaI-LiaF-like domain-containing protein [Solimicrobium silvestre]|uniref:LiaI-LiaF-like transmembrane region domain-containing protein n=1 Tax=Solimicrobium silvestre TaxID=2099400 RepID=A0A2S9H4X0_9BURK|nr:DUF5668 domain-containing protein [Solimicrobium silvestre]PRC95032.1 hypothetical protein S2091_0227 [Solimicrobium silvestre]
MNNDQLTQLKCYQEGASYHASKKIFFGLALIIVGSLFLLERFNIIENNSMMNYWPLILAMFGLNKLLFSQNTHRKISGFFQILLSFWLFACLAHLWGWTFAVTWPIILIALGLCYITTTLFIKNSVNNESAS